MFVDTALILYALVTFVAFYGFVLFAGWWAKNKCHASAVYYYVMFILFGITINNSLCAWARYLKLNEGPSEYLAFLETPCWNLRLIPLLISLLCITLHMSYRWFIQKKVAKDENC